MLKWREDIVTEYQQLRKLSKTKRIAFQKPKIKKKDKNTSRWVRRQFFRKIDFLIRVELDREIEFHTRNL